MTARVSILTSGIGLGVYVPALLIERQMSALGVRPEIEVLEGYYRDDHQTRLLGRQRAMHDDFALAQMAHRMTRGVDESLDEARLDALLGRWAEEGRREFMVWSGYWLPILDRYRARIGSPLHVDCCRIDAEVSASFKGRALPEGASEIWLWSWAKKQTLFEIPVDEATPLGFGARERRLVVHGGGWGLGTYRRRLAEIEGWSCDVVVHGDEEAQPGARCFMVDPAWRAWHRGFPPFGEVGGRFDARDHGLYELVRRAKAVVSKPGGGTLIDSLASATPIVLLEPYGYAEAANGALWEHLGFGISWEKWRSSGWDESLLEACHEKLLARTRNGPDYPRHYVERVRARS
jgi:hypothetical protein